MAYTTQITRQCTWVRCTRVATHRVHAEWGSPVGDYCKRHADTIQQEQQEREDQSRRPRKETK